MTKLLESAIEAARRLSPQEQDAIAEAIMQLAGDRSSIAPLSPDERDAIDRSKAAAARGEFASEDDVSAVWAKYGL
jgi:predicted transcriptional regulator